jgi:hypothetical protein
MVRCRDERPFLGAVVIIEKILRACLLPPLGCQALVHRDPVQPRRYLCLAAKPAQVPVSRDEGLLTRVAGIVLASEHTEAESEYLSLPTTDDLSECLRVRSYRLLDQLFITQIQHQLALRAAHQVRESWHRNAAGILRSMIWTLKVCKRSKYCALRTADRIYNRLPGGRRR